jgi:tRNA threonylcarbamoyladenosine biosynthesis protein TsaE
MTRAWCATSPDPETTRRLGELLGRLCEPGDVLALEGPLGVGKTALVQGLALGLGLGSETPVTSPTFTLIAEYPTDPPLRHADFYRVETERRLEEAGFDDLLDGRGVVVVEWAERFPAALPPDRLWITLRFARESSRRLSVRAEGARSQERLRRLEQQWP